METNRDGFSPIYTSWAFTSLSLSQYHYIDLQNKKFLQYTGRAEKEQNKKENIKSAPKT